MLRENEAQKSNLLDIEVKTYKECGYCEEFKNETLKIPWSIWNQWTYISFCMKNKEWGAVFWVKDNTITAFKVPVQKVTATECEFNEDLGGDGMVHSHHDMGAFHSSQDDRQARNLYTYSIVLTNSNEYTATKRIKLPCKGFGYCNVKLQLIDSPAIDFSKISEKSYELQIEEKKEIIPESSREELPCDSCQITDCEDCEHMDPAYALMACQDCDTFDCKTCKVTGGFDLRGILPFCEYCEGADECQKCGKLQRYLSNYPEEKNGIKVLEKIERKG